MKVAPLDMAARPPREARLPRLWFWVVEVPAALSVLAEVLLLFTSIIARTVFNAPIVWADELASTIFIWLAMLGSAVALQQGAHMRLTFLVTRLPPKLHRKAFVLATMAPALFLLILLKPAADYAAAQTIVVMPALGWSQLVHSIALPVGCAVIILGSMMRLRGERFQDLWPVLAIFVVIAGLLVLGTPMLQAIDNWNLIIFFVVLLGAGIFAGIPIAFAFGLATVAYLLIVADVPLSVVVGQLDSGMSSLILLAVPLFVLLGQLIEMTGMARVLVEFLVALLGHVRGGLYYVLIGAMLLISGISGSKAADMAAVAPVLFPEMKRRGVEEGEMVALLAATGAMSETIAPSIVLIAIGSVTNVSIAALFAGGLLPGVVLGLVLGVVAWYRARLDTTVKPHRAPARTVGRSFVIALPALVLPFFIRAAVTGGIATATEVSTLGIAYAVVIGLLIYRQFEWRRIYPMLVQTASLSGAILLIVGAASGMSWCRAGISGFCSSLSCCSSCSAVCWKAFRRWCYSGRCYSRWRSRSASTRCIMPSWPYSRWGWAFSRRQWVLAITPPALSAGSIRTRECGASGLISARFSWASCWSRRCPGFQPDFCDASDPEYRQVRSSRRMAALSSGQTGAEEAAIDCQHMTGNKARIVRAQEGGGCRDFRRHAIAMQRYRAGPGIADGGIMHLRH
jgi:TRAP-type C4-dicarboxylate transport system permease small subunit